MSSALRVIVTGASGGIGAALAKAYSADGAILGLIARREKPLHELFSTLPSPAAIYSADVRDPAALRDAAMDFVQKHGCPDIVIANAGISIGTSSEYPEDIQIFQEVMDVNVMGMVNTFHPFIQKMRQQKSGALVGIASVAGFRGLPGASAYSASKAAAISYLESLRVELRPEGIKVIAICPGYIDTPMTQGNPYPMPFIISAESAAKKIKRAIAYRRGEVVIPWQMALLSKVFKVIPRPVYDTMFSDVPRKPRRSE